MLKRKVWMADDDEFDHVVKNSQRVLKLNAQFENHPYTEEFAKERSVMFVYGTYVLWVIYGSCFRKIFYKTTQSAFAGK